jgi:hypothetical protein
LHGKGRSIAVHDHQPRSQGLFRNPAGDQGEIHGLLNVCGEQQESAGIGREVAGLVTAAGRDGVTGEGAVDEVDYQGQAPTGGKAQQVLGRGQIGGGEKGGGPGPTHGQAKRGRQCPAGALRQLAAKRCSELVTALADLLGTPGQLCRVCRKGCPESCRLADGRLGDGHRRVAVQGSQFPSIGARGAGWGAEKAAQQPQAAVSKAWHKKALKIK